MIAKTSTVFCFLLSYSFLQITAYFLPPKPWQTALMARYIIHHSDWVSISTISTLKNVTSYPFVNLKSMADGPASRGSGIPYLYMTTLDLSGQDIEKDNRVSVMATLAQSDYCKNNTYDPQDPRCARTILTGRLFKVRNNTSEYYFAQNALFSRHPAMRHWPKEHNFYIAKVEIEQVAVLDYFGGVKFVSVKDYFDANPESDVPENVVFEDVIVVDVLN